MPDYVNEAILAGYDVEVDAWVVTPENKIFLGHDEPEFEVNLIRPEFELGCEESEYKSREDQIKDLKFNRNTVKHWITVLFSNKVLKLLFYSMSSI